MGPFENQVELMATSRSPLRENDDQLFRQAAEAWLEFESHLDDDVSDRIVDRYLWQWGEDVILAFRDLAFYVLRTRKAPRSVRNLSSIAKVFTRVRSRPRDVRAWFEKNREKMRTLLSAKDWEEADAGITVEGMTVKDATGRGGLEDVVKLVQSCAVKIQRSRIPRVKDILYGEVLITPSLTSRRNLAFYRRQQDTVWVRPKTKWGPASEKTLIHELGHRYWAKFLTTGVKREWKKWDASLRFRVRHGGRENFRYPEVGDEIPFSVQGHIGPPIVQRIDFDTRRRTRKFYISEKGYITGDQIKSYYKSEVGDVTFPTEYAYRTNDPEEHFCEAFALRVLDELEEPHLSKFKKIIG